MAVIICAIKINRAWKPVTERAGGLFWALVTSMPGFFGGKGGINRGKGDSKKTGCPERRSLSGIPLVRTALNMTP